MSGQVESEVLNLGPIKPAERQRIERRAAIHIADRIGTEHPHELDELMPRLAGRLIAQDPAVRGDLLELLDAIGLTRKESDRA